MNAQPMASLLTGVVPEGFSGTPFDGEAATLAFLAADEWLARAAIDAAMKEGAK